MTVHVRDPDRLPRLGVIWVGGKDCVGSDVPLAGSGQAGVLRLPLLDHQPGRTIGFPVGDLSSPHGFLVDGNALGSGDLPLHGGMDPEPRVPRLALRVPQLLLQLPLRDHRRDSLRDPAPILPASRLGLLYVLQVKPLPLSHVCPVCA